MTPIRYGVALPKAPAQSGRVLQITIDEDDPTRDERIEAFRRDHNMADDDQLIVRVIVHPPCRRV